MPIKPERRVPTQPPAQRRPIAPLPIKSSGTTTARTVTPQTTPPPPTPPEPPPPGSRWPHQPEPDDQPPPQPPRQPWKWATGLRGWLLLSLMLCSTAGVSALLLLRVPSLPNCPAIFWPLASASMRISCAQIAAEKQTIKDLLEAIALVNSLPPDHEMRAVVNQYIEQWSLDILRLADQQFQQGKLADAIASARKIPTNTSAHKQIKAHIDRWNTIWSKAEGIYRQAEEELREGNFHLAFRQAVRLLYIGNAYWETTKYQELTNNIRIAREGSRKLSRAEELARAGGLENLLKAIEITQSVNPSSYLYRQAQKAARKYGRELLNLAQATLDDGDLQQAIAIVRKIPPSLGLQAEADDFVSLAEAQAEARKGEIPNLENAIARAQGIRPGRPLYGKAQKLATRWQLEIEALGHLDKARQLAQSGDIDDLQTAIAEAENVSRSNPRAAEAQREIQRWTVQVQTSEDQPYLDQAESIAAPGDVASLQAAIDQAQRIAEGRALYAEAQRKISTWTRQIQEIQDRPYLDRAQALADNGDIVNAITAAETIGPGRALYQQAQSKIAVWRANTQAQTSLQEAYRLASSNLPDDLASAIRTADRVSSASNRRSEATEMMNRWSQQLLTAAQAQADYNQLANAIAIAQKVPPRTEAYAQAQLQIAEWKRRLTPAPTPSEIPSSLNLTRP